MRKRQKRTYKVPDLWLREILRTLYQQRTATRADIMQAVGLNAGSISQALQLLLRNGTILKVGELESDGGRRREVFMLNPDAAYFIALDLESHRISFALASLAGDVRYRCEEDLEPGQSLDIHKLFDGIERVIRTLDPEHLGRVIAVGISYPGLLSKEGCLTAVNLGWHQFPFVSELKKVAEVRKFSDLPIFIEPEHQSCILVEQWLGCAKLYRKFAYVSSERGIGVGIFLDGTVMAGELGHLTVDPNAKERCNCGKRGCLEAIALSENIVRQYLDQTRQRGKDVASIRFTDVLERARQGDGAALAVMQRAGEAWGLALSHVVNLLNPEIIIVGGDLVAAEDVLLPLIKKEIARHCLPELAEDLKIAISSLGLDIRLKGAASLAFRKALTDSMLLKKMCSPVLASAPPTRQDSDEQPGVNGIEERVRGWVELREESRRSNGSTSLTRRPQPVAK